MTDILQRREIPRKSELGAVNKAQCKWKDSPWEVSFELGLEGWVVFRLRQEREFQESQ